MIKSRKSLHFTNLNSFINVMSIVIGLNTHERISRTCLFLSRFENLIACIFLQLENDFCFFTPFLGKPVHMLQNKWILNVKKKKSLEMIKSRKRLHFTNLNSFKNIMSIVIVLNTHERISRTCLLLSRFENLITYIFLLLENDFCFFTPFLGEPVHMCQNKWILNVKKKKKSMEMIKYRNRCISLM